MNVIIVDDEKRSRNVLASYLEQYCPDVEVIAQAGNVQDAVNAIQIHRPQLIFLDIQLPGGNGFDILDFFETTDFQVIFVTAFNDFAIKAFKVSAIDYLTKPIVIKELVKAVDKARKMRNFELYSSQVSHLKSFLNEGDQVKKIALPDINGLRFFNINEISYIEADGSYSILKSVDFEEPIMITKKLLDIEENIVHPHIFRPHRSFLINLLQVQRYKKNEGGSIDMNCGRNIPLSRYKKNEFLEKIKNLN